MAPDRRGFLKLAGGILLAPASTVRGQRARTIVDREALGSVVYCRVSHRSVGEAIESLRRLFDGETPVALTERTLRYRAFVASYEPGVDHVVICGSEATLVVDATGCARFA